MSTSHAEFGFRHTVFALLDAAAGGILAVVPVVAVKHLQATDWQLSLRMPISAFGMFAGLFLSVWMARRPKRPFLLVPGIAFALSSLALAGIGTPLLFLLVSGFGIMCELITRPAFAALIRAIYPAGQRNAILGRLRAQTSIVFLVSTVATGLILDHAENAIGWWIRALLITAGVLGLLSWAAFLHWKEPEASVEDASDPLFVQQIAEPFRDRQFVHYLVAAALFAGGGMFYVAFVPALLSRELHCGYATSMVLLEVIPLLASFAATARIGRWLDLQSVWLGWVPIRLGWAADALLLAIAPFAGVAALPLAVAARISRGTVQAASWMLWWQTGIAQLAPSMRLASTYLGLLLLINGVARFIFPPLGAALVPTLGRPGVLAVGALIVAASAIYCSIMAKQGASNSKAVGSGAKV